MYIDPDARPRRDEHGRLLPEEPFSWVFVPLIIVFVAGFWLVAGLVGVAFSAAHWALVQNVRDLPLYQWGIIGMLLLTAAVVFFHFRDVRKSISVAWAQVAIGVSGGVYALMNATSIDAQIMSVGAALVTIANGVKSLREIANARRRRIDEKSTKE